MMGEMEYSHKYVVRRIGELTRIISGLQKELETLIIANEELRKRVEENGGGFVYD